MKSTPCVVWALLALSISALTGACAKTIDSVEGETSGSSSSSSGQGGAGGGATMGAGGAGGATMGAGGAGGGSTSSALLASLSSMTMQMNCMAGKTPTIGGTFQAYYDNTAGVTSGIGIVTSSSLTMSLAGQSFVWTFPVMPSSTFVPAGQGTNAMHTAGMGSGAGDGVLCDYCGQIWTLNVSWDVGGKTISGSLGPTPVDCVQ